MYKITLKETVREKSLLAGMGKISPANLGDGRRKIRSNKLNSC